VTTSYGAGTASGDIMAIAFDLDSNTTTFYKNNVSQGSISKTFTGDYRVVIGNYSGVTRYATANFGQDSSFAGAKTAQGNQDGNSIGDFYYTPPTDFLALCTSNLPAVAVTPSEHFTPYKFDGNATEPHARTGVGFAPDLMWLKNRETTGNNLLYDNVRGATGGYMYGIRTDTNQIQSSQGDEVISLDADGFTVAEGGDCNGSGQGIITWLWKIGGSGSANTVGDLDSTVSVNADAGISMGKFTGDGVNGRTIGHGLGSAPEMIWIKRMDSQFAAGWGIGHDDLTGGDWSRYLILNDTSTETTGGGVFNSVAPTSTVLTVADNYNVDTEESVFYCFKSIDGHSKVGIYTGNASTDGTFVYTGFRPSMIWMKRSNSAGQQSPIYDSVRDTYNVAVTSLKSDDNTIEQTNQGTLDFLSNGFKTRDSEGSTNSSGGTYIYMAFAETPFKYSNAR